MGYADKYMADTLAKLKEAADLSGVDFSEIDLAAHVVRTAAVKANVKGVVTGDVSGFVERTMELTGYPTLTELTKYFGCSYPTFQKARSEGVVLYAWLARLAMDYAINPYYVLYGCYNKKYLTASDLPMLDKE